MNTYVVDHRARDSHPRAPLAVIVRPGQSHAQHRHHHPRLHLRRHLPQPRLPPAAARGAARRRRRLAVCRKRHSVVPEGPLQVGATHAPAAVGVGEAEARVNPRPLPAVHAWPIPCKRPLPVPETLLDVAGPIAFLALAVAPCQQVVALAYMYICIYIYIYIYYLSIYLSINQSIYLSLRRYIHMINVYM